jgi:hypothetical protein
MHNSSDLYLNTKRVNPPPDFTHGDKHLFDLMNNVSVMLDNKIKSNNNLINNKYNNVIINKPTSLKASELPELEYKVTIPNTPNHIIKIWDKVKQASNNLILKDCYEEDLFPVPCKWHRIPVPSSASPGAVRFDYIPDLTTNANGIFAYMIIPEKNILVLSNDFIMSRMFLETYSRHHYNHSISSTTDKNIIERMGIRALRPACKGLNPFVASKDSEAMIVIKMSPTDADAKGIIELASVTPYAFTSKQVENILTKGALGFAEITVTPDTIGSVMIDYAVVKENTNAALILESVFMVVPSDYSPNVHFRISFSSSSLWITTAIKHFKFGRPVPFYPVSCYKNNNLSVGPEEIAGVELTCSRTTNNKNNNDVISTFSIIDAIKEVVFKSQYLLTSEAGGPGKHVSRVSGTAKISNLLINKLYNKYRNQSFDVNGNFTAINENGYLDIVNYENDLSLSPMKSESDEIKINYHINPVHYINNKLYPFIVKSIDNDKISIADFVEVLNSINKNLSCFYIFNSEGVYAIIPSTTFVLFLTMLSTIISAEDAANNTEHRNEIWEFMFMNMVRNIDKDNVIKSSSALTFHDIIKDKSRNPRIVDYLNNVIALFHKLILHHFSENEKDYHKMPLFDSFFISKRSAMVEGVISRRI